MDEFPDAAEETQRVVAVPLREGASPSPSGPGAGLIGDVDLGLVARQAKNGQVALVATAAATVALVGIPADQPTAAQWRDAAASAARAALAGGGELVIAFDLDTAEEAGAVALGALLGSYRFDRYRTPSDQPVLTIQVIVPSSLLAEAGAGAQRAQILAAAVSQARDLVNRAPNDLTPETFAQIAVDSTAIPNVTTTVLDEEDLAAGSYGGLIAVGQGSVNKPRLVKVAYKPARAASHVALVGKGITFDSGGISLKPPKSMETMKCDMAGAAAVLAAVTAAARLELPVAVTGWLCLAENMPSGSATRPSDVITIRGGKTVEVLNTDAEGRLVMADGLAAAVEENPDTVIDIATLTGAQMVALGTQTAAVMGSEDVRAAVVEAGTEAGEAFWPMPLPSYLRESLKSKVANLANIGDRYGGMLVAGIFLREFVGQVPWAHLDIAGPAFNERKVHGITPVGGTGFGVSTIVHFLEEVASTAGTETK